MSQALFALIDCNNFFVSCEQIFRPDLHNKPVVVLSSNDGCVVARSAEARALGIPMAAPAFKYKQVFKDNQVIQFSANFELYGDISRRITEILTTITPRLEVYSIDESFLDISQLDIANHDQWAKLVRRKIFEWAGINVSIGIAPTKTLAKLASERAKQDPNLGGTLYIHKTNWQHHLSKVPLEDVWGIGRRLAPRLRAYGLATALDIASLTPEQGRHLFSSVHGERMVRELNMQSCLPLEGIKIGQHSISATRTFGSDTNKSHDIESALATFAVRAGQRLRAHNMRAKQLGIFLTTDRHKPNYQKWSAQLKLSQATADTGELIHIANSLFTKLYQPRAQYHRGGILIYDLEPDKALQTDVFGIVNIQKYKQSKNRMNAIDQLNNKYGRRVVRFGSEDLARSWQPRRRISSPRYTTSWHELPKVKVYSP
jgi:DNA polymerase V